MKLLSCPVCLKPHFEGVDELRSSLINVATAHISCPVCKEVLMGLDKLTIHLFSHINQNLIQENSLKQTNSQTTKTVIDHDDVKKIMDVENYNNLIEESILTIPQENECKKTIRCDICNFYFADENILEMHQKLLHQTQVDVKTGQCNYHCHLCSKKFKMRGSLMVHLRVAHYGFANQDHNGIFDKTTKTIETSQNTDKPEKSPDGKQWVCDVCSKQFTTKYFLKKHKRLHTGEMPYFCAPCNKSFTFQQSYHKHMLYHSSDKPHLCSECGRAFKELSTLHNHERIHSGEKPFICETCGKSFRQRVSYLVHRRIHTGVMPYKCTACDKSFRYKVSQKSHKCPMNPPGSVVRMSIVENLKEKSPEETSIEPRVAVKPMETDLNQSSPTPSQKFNLTVFPQQPPLGFLDQNCFIKVEDGKSLKTEPVNVQNNNVNTVNTIIINAEGQIIGQNFTIDGQNIITITPKLITSDCAIPVVPIITDDNKTNETPSQNNNFYDKFVTNTPQDQQQDTNNKEFELYDENSNKSPDFLAMVLSPIMPDVQSLCLTNSPNSENEDNGSKQPLETINEESFKKLLDGLSNCL